MTTSNKDIAMSENDKLTNKKLIKEVKEHVSKMTNDELKEKLSKDIDPAEYVSKQEQADEDYHGKTESRNKTVASDDIFEILNRFSVHNCDCENCRNAKYGRIKQARQELARVILNMEVKDEPHNPNSKMNKVGGYYLGEEIADKVRGSK